MFDRRGLLAAELNPVEKIEEALQTQRLQVSLERDTTHTVPTFRHRRLRSEGVRGESLRWIVTAFGDITPAVVSAERFLDAPSSGASVTKQHWRSA